MMSYDFRSPLNPSSDHIRNNHEFAFEEIHAKQWRGYYDRVEGKSSVFSIRHEHSEWNISIKLVTEDSDSLCWADSDDEIENLIESVNRVKMNCTGREGGAFQINEYGQVLVPTNDYSNEIYYIGDTSGRIYFHDPNSYDLFHLDEETGMEPGEDWSKPYMGMPYSLSKNDEIYIWDKLSRSKITPVIQDYELIDKIRCFRPYGPVRFIVNHCGVILTKKPSKDGMSRASESSGYYSSKYYKTSSYRRSSDVGWSPIYIGKINFNRWFKRYE